MFGDDFLKKYIGDKGIVPVSYLVTVNEQLKNQLVNSPNFLYALEEIVNQYCKHEYKNYGDKSFSSYIYTVIVSAMNNGDVSGIKPDLPWYNPKYVPPKSSNDWIENSQTEDTKTVESVGNKTVDNKMSNTANINNDVNSLSEFEQLKKEFKGMQDLLVRLLPNVPVDNVTKNVVGNGG